MDERIFPYTVGSVTLFGDPKKMLRDFELACDGDPKGCFEATKSENVAVSAPAHEKILAAGRKVFGLAPVNPRTGDGVLEDDVMDLLYSFFAWIEKKNRKPEPTPSLPPATESPPTS